MMSSQSQLTDCSIGPELVPTAQQTDKAYNWYTCVYTDYLKRVATQVIVKHRITPPHAPSGVGVTCESHQMYRRLYAQYTDVVMGPRYSSDTPGYCYLHMCGEENRGNMARMLGPYPRLTEVIFNKYAIEPSDKLRISVSCNGILHMAMSPTGVSVLDLYKQLIKRDMNISSQPVDLTSRVGGDIIRRLSKATKLARIHARPTVYVNTQFGKLSNVQILSLGKHELELSQVDSGWYKCGCALEDGTKICLPPGVYAGFPDAYVGSMVVSVNLVARDITRVDIMVPRTDAGIDPGGGVSHVYARVRLDVEAALDDFTVDDDALMSTAALDGMDYVVAGFHDKSALIGQQVDPIPSLRNRIGQEYVCNGLASTYSVFESGFADPMFLTGLRNRLGYNMNVSGILYPISSTVDVGVFSRKFSVGCVKVDSGTTARVPTNERRFKYIVKNYDELQLERAAILA